MEIITYLKVKGHIMSNGKLEVQLPVGVVIGQDEVEVMVELRQTDSTHVVDEAITDTFEPMFTKEELAEMLRPDPVPTHLIQTGGWSGDDFEDSVEWVNNLRRAEEQRRIP